uniref:cob(I)yrinic acid a,c-diamide adenosyltransferase, mitochondrial-like n=1 Tax=Ciona intestinalis TaxID=7719 RepID=UPI0005215AE6|nr:cob(I)yrinic acid a,c-diamide adenosyltransferase, mitochondrial-like [Ciona intestinalis]|eukprot:XP_009862379.1 cob(I)yrinic acid a,c-diamide adenosyltransferase, mitochondrial-like [Ciona intestinalis]
MLRKFSSLFVSRCGAYCLPTQIEHITSTVNAPFMVHQQRAVKVYTKTGDKGTTSLFTGERRTKFHEVFDALGDVDELNSNIGLARQHLVESPKHVELNDISKFLERIQCTLLDIGSCVATPPNTATEKQLQRTEFDSKLVEELEEWIDHYWTALPELKNFILPSGGKSSCSLHVSRSVCRRAERKVSVLFHKDEVSADVAKYVNRLSDLLFTLARYVAFVEGNEEIIYKKPK